jgi:hypothetical protein
LVVERTQGGKPVVAIDPEPLAQLAEADPLTIKICPPPTRRLCWTCSSTIHPASRRPAPASSGATNYDQHPDPELHGAAPHWWCRRVERLPESRVPVATKYRRPPVWNVLPDE